MTKLADARINTFGPALKADVLPSEDPIFVLTSSQLQDIITRALQPLQDEVAQLLATVANQSKELASLRSKIATQEQDITDLETRAFDHIGIAFGNIKQLRKAVEKEPEDDSPLLNELYKEMKAIGRKQTDFATAARMVKRSKGRMLQLKAAIALDQRFILIPSESHSQKLLIRLREVYKTA